MSVCLFLSLLLLLLLLFISFIVKHGRKYFFEVMEIYLFPSSQEISLWLWVYLLKAWLLVKGVSLGTQSC